MSKNGIAWLTTKESKQKAKLDLAQAKRQGRTVGDDGSVTGLVDSTKPYYRPNNIYDLSLLPTQYNSNAVVNNANQDGLQLGRPWEVIAQEGQLIFELSGDNHASYSGSGTVWRDALGDDRGFLLFNTPALTKTEPGYLTFTPGSLQYAETPSIGDLNQWTVESWFRVTSSMTANGANANSSIITTVYEDGSRHYGKINYCITNYNGVNGATNQIYVGFYNGAWHMSNGQFTPPLNTWVHVVGTYDGVTLKQYNNGVLAGSNVVNQTSSANSGPTRLARRWDGNLQSQWIFPGDIGLVRLYSGVLTADQVAENYTQSRARFGF